MAALDDFAKKRRSIYRKISALKGQINDLLKERNDWTPVGRLSNEILVEIFSYLQGAWRPRYSGRIRPSILKVTHISHRWRAVALECPALWSEIFFHCEDQVKAWIERSRSYNLYVSMQASHRKSVQKVLECLPRIRHLTIESDLEGPRLPPLPKTPAPVLSQLSISGKSNNPIRSLPFLSQHLPALRDLSIKYCGAIDLTFASFPSLTSFHIEDCSITTTVPALLDLLGNMPGLASVRLSTLSLTGSSPSLSDSLPTVNLPEIGYFYYQGTRGDLDFQLLHQLRFTRPSFPKVIFETQIPRLEGNPPTILRVLASIGDLWMGLSQLHEFINLDLCNRTLSLRTSKTYVCITSPSASDIYDQYLSWMLENISLFTTLHSLSASRTINPGFWPVLKRLNQLHQIDIQSLQSGELFNLFTENWESRNLINAGDYMQADVGVIFPDLDEIIIGHANFNTVPWNIIDALQDRPGNPLSLLKLLNCTGLKGSSWRTRLEGVVGSVIVEGEEESEEEDDENDDDESDATESSAESDRCYACNARFSCDVCR